jgi:hypothetical protein
LGSLSIRSSLTPIDKAIVGVFHYLRFAITNFLELPHNDQGLQSDFYRLGAKGSKSKRSFKRYSTTSEVLKCEIAH